MKVDTFPRTMKKGLLRGRTFQTLGDYERARREVRSTGTLDGRRHVTASGKARCAKCGKWKDARRDFYASRKTAAGIQSYCVPCQKALGRVPRAKKAKAEPRVVRAEAPTRSVTTWRVEVVRSDGTTIRAEMPREDAERLLLGR